MQQLNARNWPVLALTISLAVLIGAWIFQYGFGYMPCQMCYWQRHAHKLIIGLSVMALILNHFNIGSPRFWGWLIILACLGSAALALWHTGVENKWWPGPKTCAASVKDLTDFDPQAFLDSLQGPQKLPSCTEATWHFLDLSMAGWNVLISGFSAILGVIAVTRKTS